MKNIIEQITQETIERYNKRYNKMGYDVRTLGWGSEEQQIYRFYQTFMMGIDFNNKTIIDIGCGFGDYLKFLNENSIKYKKYIGYDINPNLIFKAKEIYKNRKNVIFEEKNILQQEEKNIADIGVMLGLLNFNLKNRFDNYKYSEQMIKKAFDLVNEVLIVDFLSSQLTDSYPKEDFVFYHEPEKILQYALTLSNNVILKHNYKPIPQKEFMLFIFKEKI